MRRPSHKHQFVAWLTDITTIQAARQQPAVFRQLTLTEPLDRPR